jgi:hypothetical protein
MAEALTITAMLLVGAALFGPALTQSIRENRHPRL